jgi:phosphatidylserine/phosphatidylglycerophosphate/cardiolipin synthase-like enzyme
MYSLFKPLQSLIDRKVKVYVLTRDPNDHNLGLKQQAEEVIRRFEAMGVQVLITTDYSHRKLAILDRTILWEGSLNILSRTMSREFMRRIDSQNQAQECFKFINLGKYIY